MLKLTLNELKLIAKSRGIKDYESKSEDDLIKILSERKTKTSLSKKKIRDIRKDFNKSRYKFSKSKIKEIRKNLYNIKNPKNLSESKIKEIEKNLFELEESLSKLKKYYDYDDAEYKGIRDVGNLFNQSTDEDYYKPIKTKSAFNGNYIEYESNGDKDKNLSAKKYLNMIRPYLNDIINDHKTPKKLRVHSSNEVFDYETQYGEWKIQLTMAINFVSSKDDSDEIRTMHTKSDNIEIMMGSETNEITEELFKSLLQRYQEGLEESMKGSEFVFDSAGLLEYKLNKISLNRGGSYIDSPEWLKNKRATINPKNNEDNSFQYALTIAINYLTIKKDPQRISKIKPFLNQYNWKETEFPAQPSKKWKNFESNNNSIAFNILYIPYTEKIRLAYKSKRNFKRNSQVILLNITDGRKWYYLTVKKLSVLLRGITSNHVADFYCLNCFHSYSTEKKT